MSENETSHKMKEYLSNELKILLKYENEADL